MVTVTAVSRSASGRDSKMSFDRITMSASMPARERALALLVVRRIRRVARIGVDRVAQLAGAATASSIASRGSSDAAGQLLPNRMRACPSLSRLSSSRLRRSRAGDGFAAAACSNALTAACTSAPFDGLHHHVPVVLVEQRDGALDLRRVARTHHRDAAELQRRIVGKLVAQLVQLEHVGLGDGRRHGDRRVDANAEVAVLADFVEQLELFVRSG